MPIKDFIAENFGPSAFEDEAFKQMQPAQLASALGIARGTSEGTVPDFLQGRSNEELADLDRVQFSRRTTRENPLIGLIGGLGLAGSDAVKAIPGANAGIGHILGALGASDASVKEFTSPNEHTSKPSLRQAISNLRGVGMGFEDIFNTLRGQ